MSRIVILLRRTLAVLVILIVTALFLFPYFAKARECGRCVGCSSNVKQIGLVV